MRRDYKEKFNNEFKKVKKGEKLYKKIIKKCDDSKIYIFPHKSLGDIYILGLYKDADCKMFKEKYCLVLVGEGCKKVAQLCQLKNIICISQIDMEALIKYVMICGEETLNCKILHFLYYHTNIFFKIINYKKYNFIECYSKYVFKQELIKKPANKMFFRTIISASKHNTDKSIVIAPYAKSVENFSYDFWMNLVALLKDCGFHNIYTNCSDTESPLNGTKKINISLEDISQFVENIGVFIGIRSGLCDLISYTNCKKLILYPSKSYIDNYLEYYSLKNIPYAQNYKEYEILDECIPFDDMLNYLEGER